MLREANVRSRTLNYSSFADFFDTGASKSHIEVKPVVAKSTVATAPGAVPEESSALPEGFFDDPQVDARMRKVEYVDKMEVEWDMFTREMKQEANVGKHARQLRFHNFPIEWSVLDIGETGSHRRHRARR